VLDTSNARNLRQVAYYYVEGTDEETNPSSLSWDTAWRGNLIYLFDMDRGIEILRLKRGPRHTSKLATVREPRARIDRLAKVPVSGLTRGSLVARCSSRSSARGEPRRDQAVRLLLAGVAAASAA
jgi:hypothetical protein